MFSKKTRSLFTETGFMIPDDGPKEEFCEPDVTVGFRCGRQEAINPERCLRAFTFLNTAFSTQAIMSASAGEFHERIVALEKQIKGNEVVANILGGPGVPMFIPSLHAGNSYTRMITGHLSSTLQCAYERGFPGQTFNNLCKDSLDGHITVAKESRHDVLLARANQVTYGILFPQALQGHAVEAQRRQMIRLPDNFLLCGPQDLFMGFIENADILAREGSPGLCASAVNWGSSSQTVAFWPKKNCLDYGTRGELKKPNSKWSGGIFVISQD